MSRPGEMVELLRAAFPRDDRDVPRCAFCGAWRHPRHALCKTCWAGIGPVRRAFYLGLTSLTDRAQWIVDELKSARAPR